MRETVIVNGLTFTRVTPAPRTEREKAYERDILSSFKPKETDMASKRKPRKPRKGGGY